LPAGEIQPSENTGDVEIFRHHVAIELPLLREDHYLKPVNLKASYQG
jgi:hypothetical protein